MSVEYLTQAFMSELPRLPKTVFFHGKGKLLDKAINGQLNMIDIILRIAQRSGYKTQFLHLSQNTEQAAAANRRHLHLILADVPYEGHNIFYVVPSYINGFWYFDPKGSRNNSSLRDDYFKPSKINAGYASRFANKLFLEYAAQNLSKYPQDLARNFKPPKDAICIFTQDFAAPKYHKNFIEMSDLIDSVIEHRGSRAICIKPHPLQTFDDARVLMDFHNPNDNIHVTQHSIHGLLNKASVAITQTSAVAFEANIHKVPMILAGETDFHHNAITVRTVDDIASALTQAQTRKFKYKKYLVWFLVHRLLQPCLVQETDNRVVTILQAAGFPMKPLPS